MKKTLVSALTTALVVGAASTTFAAANPFSDVPTDHWAYDAVSQLAKDGVVDGYGDSTFKGDNAITRYEMAQIVAKAMAKEDQANAADKAMIDKLAAEFSNELNNLGVRVSNLEKKTDNVKFTGEVQYTYTSDRHDGQAKNNKNDLLFRLEPTATINNNWVAKARIDYETQSAANVKNATVDRAYVQGTYGNTVINAGKIPYTSSIDNGMVFDSVLAGGQVKFGKDVKATVTAGRYNITDNGLGSVTTTVDDTANFQALEVGYQGKKLSAGAADYRISDYGQTYNIWELAAGYKFTPTFAMNAAYAKNNDINNSSLDRAASVEFDYKGAQPANKGSFGVFAAYRHLDGAAVIHTTYDAIAAGQKGVELGANYTFAPNIVGTAKYFTGKDLSTDKNASKFFGRVEFFF